MRGPAAIGVGLSVSLDELAIGFVIGLLRLPALAVALLVGAQALLASQLGLRLGARLGERLGERAEQAAGLLLVAPGRRAPPDAPHVRPRRRNDAERCLPSASTLVQP
jgi:manganese efflux pump family protein